MADTAHKTEEEKKEYFDSEEDLDIKCEVLAQLIKTSKHFIAFTGAGISTSAGIPDYRSGKDTVLPTGPGAWEKAATGTKNAKATVRKAMGSAIPTKTHMALVKLEQQGYLKYIISQNVDGLHRKSGFPASKLAEVHGNTNLEICKGKNCKKSYMRDFRVRTAKKVHDHDTGRVCENCGGKLYDTIINFGENLPEKELNDGFANGAAADLCIAMGSSLRVTPAADMPLETVRNGGKLVIINLQATPLDNVALKINGLVDDVIARVMKKLELEIPPFTLVRRVKVVKTDVDPKNPTKKVKPSLVIRGVDETGSPYTLFKKVEVVLIHGKESFAKEKEPVTICPTKTDLKEGRAKIKLEFQGHYNEPNYDFEVDMTKCELNKPRYFLLEFDPSLKKWIKFQEISIGQPKQSIPVEKANLDVKIM